VEELVRPGVVDVRLVVLPVTRVEVWEECKDVWLEVDEKTVEVELEWLAW
jgi:hypothetical protein